MSKFTLGKWWIAPPIFDGDAIFAPPQEKGRRNEVVAMGILNHADARLITAAPELYWMVYNMLYELKHGNGANPEYVKQVIPQMEELLARIDVEESEHE